MGSFAEHDGEKESKIHEQKSLNVLKVFVFVFCAIVVLMVVIPNQSAIEPIEVRDLRYVVVSSCIESNSFSHEITKTSLDNKNDYCKKHDNVECYLSSRQNTSLIRIHQPKWRKYSMLLEKIESYDWAIWMDCDTLIVNNEINFEQTGLDESVSSDLILTHDWNGVNLGVFMVRNTEWSRNFLQNMFNQRIAVEYATKKRWLTNGWRDQNALIFLRDTFYSQSEFKSHVKITSNFTKNFNSFCLDETTLIHHRVDCHSRECKEYFKCVADNVKQNSRTYTNCKMPQKTRNTCQSQRNHLN